MIYIDLLASKRSEEAHLKNETKRPRPTTRELSLEAKAARAPLPPEALVDALQDRVHRDPGRARVARTVRNTQRQTT